jgi:hypothetical protein
LHRKRETRNDHGNKIRSDSTNLRSQTLIQVTSWLKTQWQQPVNWLATDMSPIISRGWGLTRLIKLRLRGSSRWETIELRSRD